MHSSPRLGKQKVVRGFETITYFPFITFLPFPTKENVPSDFMAGLNVPCHTSIKIGQLLAGTFRNLFMLAHELQECFSLSFGSTSSIMSKFNQRPIYTKLQSRQ